MARSNEQFYTKNGLYDSALPVGKDTGSRCSNSFASKDAVMSSDTKSRRLFADFIDNVNSIQRLAEQVLVRRQPTDCHILLENNS